MDLEPEEVEEEGNDDQTDSTGDKMLAKGEEIQCSFTSVDIEKTPEVKTYGTSNGEEGECTDILCGDDTAHGEPCQEEPLPPFPAKGFMSLLEKSDVGKNAQGHEEDESRIEEDQSGLSNVGVVE